MAAGAQAYTLDGEAVENWAILPLYAELRNIRFDPERMERLVLEVGGKPVVLYSLSADRIPVEPQRKHWRKDVVCKSLEKGPTVETVQT